jgi:hypothetical protein
MATRAGLKPEEMGLAVTLVWSLPAITGHDSADDPVSKPDPVLDEMSARRHLQASELADKKALVGQVNLLGGELNLRREIETQCGIALDAAWQAQRCDLGWIATLELATGLSGNATVTVRLARAHADIPSWGTIPPRVPHVHAF